MPRTPALALITLIVLSPSLANALPQRTPNLPAAERTAGAPGLFSKLWDLLSAVWTNGAGLEPDGATAGGTDPNAANSGDNGSGLEPDGRP